MKRFFRVPRDRRDPADGRVLNYWPLVGIELFMVLSALGMATSVAALTSPPTATTLAVLGYLTGLGIAWSLARLARHRVDRNIKPRRWEYVLEAAGPWVIPPSGAVGAWLGGLTDGIPPGEAAGLTGLACLAGFTRAFMFLDFPQDYADSVATGPGAGAGSGTPPADERA